MAASAARLGRRLPLRALVPIRVGQTLEALQVARAHRVPCVFAQRIERQRVGIHVERDVGERSVAADGAKAVMVFGQRSEQQRQASRCE